MSLVKEQFEFLKDFNKLIQYAIEKGYVLTYGETYRPQLMQEYYFKTGKSKTLNSKHGKKLAGDLNIFWDIDNDGDIDYTTKYEYIKLLGDYWESLNPKNRWGGDWNGNDIQDEKFVDTPHFERNI